MRDKISLGNLCNPTKGQLSLEKDALIDYVDISSIDNENKTITGYETYEFSEAPSRARKIVSKGNIIISTVRPNLNAVAMFDVDTENVPVVSTGFCVLDCKEGVDSQFVFNFCRSKAFIEDMISKATGASYPAVSDKIIKGALVPVYTFEEQKQISDRLRVVSGIITLRKQELLELDNLIKSRFVEMFGDVTQNPNDYPVKDFDEISVLITDGEHATPRRTEKGIFLLSARNVLNHALQLDDVDYIDEDEYARIARRVVPQAGDVLISCSGSIGRCCVVPDGLKFQMVRSAALIRFNDTINPVFAEWLITSDELQRQIAQSATQSSQANLFQGKIRKLHGYVPPMELQEQFANFVHQVDKSKVTTINFIHTQKG